MRKTRQRGAASTRRWPVAVAMLAQQRRMRILEMLREEGSGRVSNLSQAFGVSEPTVRLDLDRLEAEGLVVREHGGAYLKSVPQQVRALSLQHRENMDRKVRIARAAAQIVDNGDSLILDSGSTVTEIAKCLDDKKDLRIITNALNIALLLGAQFRFDVMVTGGEFKAPTLSLTGEKAAAFFSRIHVNKLFLATGGISFDVGLSYPGLSDLPVKRAMIAAADETYLVADSTKIGRAAFAALGGLDRIQHFITDTGISDEDLKRFKALGIDVILAK